MSKFATPSSSSFAAKPAIGAAKPRKSIAGRRKDSGDATIRETVSGKALSAHSSTSSSRRSSADSQTSDGLISKSRVARLSKPSPAHQDRKKTGEMNGQDTKPVQTVTPSKGSITSRSVTSRPVSAAESKSSVTNSLTRKSVDSSSKPQMSGKDAISSDKCRLKPKKPEKEIYIPRGRRIAQEKQQIEKEKTELNKVSEKPNVSRVASNLHKKAETNKPNSHISSNSGKRISKRLLPVQKVHGPVDASSVPKTNAQYAQSTRIKSVQKSTAASAPKQSKVSKTSHHSPVRLLDSGTDTEGSESCDEDFTFVPAPQLDSQAVANAPVGDLDKEREDVRVNSITVDQKPSDQIECDVRFPVCEVSPNSRTADTVKEAVVTAESPPGAKLSEGVVESSVFTVVHNIDNANYVARNEALKLQTSDEMCCDVESVLPDSKNDDKEVIVVEHDVSVTTRESSQTGESTSQIHSHSNFDCEGIMSGNLSYDTDTECQSSLEFTNAQHMAVCSDSESKGARRDPVQDSESIVEDSFCDTPVVLPLSVTETDNSTSIVTERNNEDLEKELSKCSEECMHDGVKIVSTTHEPNTELSNEHSLTAGLVDIVTKHDSSSLDDSISMSTFQMQHTCETSKQSIDSTCAEKEHSQGSAREIITIESSDDDDMPELVSTECDEGEVADPESWDALYDENGDCLDPELLAELTAAVGKVSVDFPQFDYYNWKPKGPTFDEGEHSHIVEAYDFPSEFKTEDLISVFSDFKSKGFDIKWVDDTHALIAFSSPIAAEDALRLCHPLLKTRPLSEASKEGRAKARRCLEFLQPYKPRPETTAVAARRMVTGALGLKPNITREQREKERQALRDAKEKKKLIAQQRQDIWEGR